jgi:hypothetical protein
VSRISQYLILAASRAETLKVFAGLGHIAVGLEGVALFAKMARAYSGCGLVAGFPQA